MLRRFAGEAKRRLRKADGAYRRHHIQALAQRVEVGLDEIRITGSRAKLLGTLAGAGLASPGVFKTATEVRAFEPKWLPGIGEAETFVATMARPDSRSLRRELGQSKRERDRALRKAERQSSSLRHLAVSLVLVRGQVRTSDLTSAGVHRPMLAPMCEEGLLTRLRFGVYGPGPNAAAFVEPPESGQGAKRALPA